MTIKNYFCKIVMQFLLAIAVDILIEIGYLFFTQKIGDFFYAAITNPGQLY